MTRKPRAKKRPSRIGRAKPPVRQTVQARSPTKAVRAKAARPAPRIHAGDPLDDFIAAAARALDLPLAPQWKGAVKANLAVTLRFAAAVAEFKLPDEAEPAPVFRA
jgi:hypothetical protein